MELFHGQTGLAHDFRKIDSAKNEVAFAAILQHLPGQDGRTLAGRNYRV
jgi:hypothetical protein